MESPLILMAEAETAGWPPWKLLCEARPQCQSWRKTGVPRWWRASVILAQPATWASL